MNILKTIKEYRVGICVTAGLVLSAYLFIQSQDARNVKVGECVVSVNNDKIRGGYAKVLRVDEKDQGPYAIAAVYDDDGRFKMCAAAQLEYFWNVKNFTRDDCPDFLEDHDCHSYGEG